MKGQDHETPDKNRNEEVYNGKTIKKYPSPLVTRIILIAGLVILLPLYTYLIYRFTSMNIDSTQFGMLWLSLSKSGIIDFLKQIDQQNFMGQFILTYQLNIISLIGYIFTFFSLLLIIARHIPPSSRLYTPAFIFVLLPPITGVLDIIFSIILLAVLTNLTPLADWIVYCNGINYIIRIIFIYITFIWIIVAVMYFIVRRVRKKGTQKD
jgi:hypothetical protein